MAEPAAIAALVRMPRAAFNRYAQSESIMAFAREIDCIVRDQRQDYIVFTYVADKKCFFYFQWGAYSSNSLDRTITPASRR